MKRIFAAVAAAAIAVAVAACAGGAQAPVTETSETVASYCMQSRVQETGHLRACIIDPANRVCSSERRTEAVSAWSQAQNFCGLGLAETATNLNTIKGYVARQRDAAR